jgi:ATP-dependent Lhr-like helicase
VAWQLLLRWGVVFRDVFLKERLAVPWREILWALRRLEARGLTRGGHFVAGVTGEQFANDTTIPLLRRQGSAQRLTAMEPEPRALAP